MISNLRSASSTAIPLCVRQTTVLAEVLIFAVTGICLTMKDAAHVVVSQSEARMADSTAGWKVIGQGANALAAQVDALAAVANPESVKKILTLLERRKAFAKANK